MSTKKQSYMYYLLLTVVLAIALFLPVKTVNGAEEDLTYTISLEAVDNQINKGATYYDLLVTPSQKQNLTVLVSNTGSEAKKIRVTPTNAVTNQNGVIDYSRQAKDYVFDSNLKVPFTSMVGPEQIVEVGPGESKPVVFELSVPETPFVGTILGGFLADLPEEKKEEEESSGVKIVNKFQLVKAVMLREKEDKVTPDLVLNEVKPSLVSYRTAVTANLQNTQPTMFGKMKVEAEVTRKGQTEVIKSQTVEDMEMAPYSNFDFPIMWDNQPLEAGDYTLNLVATSGEEEWKFTKDFTITAKQRDEINKEAVDLEERDTPYWWYLLIAVLILVVFISLAIFIYYKKKKKKEEKRRKKSNSYVGKQKSKKSTSSPSRKKSIRDKDDR